MLAGTPVLLKVIGIPAVTLAVGTLHAPCQRIRLLRLGCWYLQAHIVSLETTDENRAALLVGLDYLVKISFVEDDEVFKICLDYWNYFVPDVYSRCAAASSTPHDDGCVRVCS